MGRQKDLLMSSIDVSVLGHRAQWGRKEREDAISGEANGKYLAQKTFENNSAVSMKEIILPFPSHKILFAQQISFSFYCYHIVAKYNCCIGKK